MGTIGMFGYKGLPFLITWLIWICMLVDIFFPPANETPALRPSNRFQIRAVDVRESANVG